MAKKADQVSTTSSHVKLSSPDVDSPVTRTAETTLISPGRRDFLRRTAIAGFAVSSATAGASVAQAAKLPVPETNKTMGEPIPEEAYGMPFKFEGHVKRRRSDVFVNRQNFSDWSMTPLQDQVGIITPNGLFFERHHNGVPEIDPEQHTLAIHGLVERPLSLHHE